MSLSLVSGFCLCQTSTKIKSRFFFNASNELLNNFFELMTVFKLMGKELFVNVFVVQKAMEQEVDEVLNALGFPPFLLSAAEVVGEPNILCLMNEKYIIGYNFERKSFDCYWIQVIPVYEVSKDWGLFGGRT